MRRILTAGILCALVAAAGSAAPEPVVYRVELKGGSVVLASDRPRDAGAMLVFRLHPAGQLTSIRKTEVVRVLVTPVRVSTPAFAGLRPGDQVVLGATGSGSGRAAAGPAAPGRPAGHGTRPGERSDGTALHNPDRAYRPEWDSRQVPGLNMPYPAAPNDYREGFTLAYPPANAVQSGPGQPPMMPPTSGEVPKAPN
ncbi:MAG: hypothetical protein ABR576_05435 [Thermoanaerobaculia bacterium]